MHYNFEVMKKAHKRQLANNTEKSEFNTTNIGERRSKNNAITNNFQDLHSPNNKINKEEIKTI